MVHTWRRRRGCGRALWARMGRGGGVSVGRCTCRGTCSKLAPRTVDGLDHRADEGLQDIEREEEPHPDDREPACVVSHLQAQSGVRIGAPTALAPRVWESGQGTKEARRRRVGRPMCVPPRLLWARSGSNGLARQRTLMSGAFTMSSMLPHGCVSGAVDLLLTADRYCGVGGFVFGVGSIFGCFAAQGRIEADNKALGSAPDQLTKLAI